MQEKDITAGVVQIAKQAREAARGLRRASGEQKNAMLETIATNLETETPAIIAANKKDISRAEEAGRPAWIIDRLRLDEQRIASIAAGVRAVAALPDPVGEIVRGKTLPNGLKVRQTRVPMGVIGMIYEARPNVTVDAAVLALKAGSAVILRGGSDAFESNRKLVELMQTAAQASGYAPESIQTIDAYGRQGGVELMKLRGLVDLVIPRGGAGLIQTVVRESLVPVIETGTGNCHVYIDRRADLAKGLRIALNAKLSRPSVCNAAETILVHQDIAEEFLPGLLSGLVAGGVRIHADPATVAIAEYMNAANARADAGANKAAETDADAPETVAGAPEAVAGVPEAVAEAQETGAPAAPVRIVPATEEDWATEYLDLEVAIRVVPDINTAVEHISTFSTGHTEAIVSEDIAAINYFEERVDSAALMINASTRFTDGGELGLGAEIGISTQKLHARGPMGLEELTTTTWIVEGNGQVR
ncbi:gamma-glutamyl phosphate reductase [Actinobaculum suis]|uniref:Gamma-glutamyl phosphate reductase n=1 Tax=Actinobaculum suis TaxID=1657 RepID=A0A7Z8Y990_9ACTO|nr:glutamate-5-semialdehyde dehydrogenase [Actinobaculum suis]VDG76294.1 gamma-glutamyl phosphate reductase [Actinobaculum suis]